MQIYNKKEECDAEYPIFKYFASYILLFLSILREFRVPLYHMIFLTV